MILYFSRNFCKDLEQSFNWCQGMVWNYHSKVLAGLKVCIEFYEILIRVLFPSDYSGDRLIKESIRSDLSILEILHDYNNNNNNYYYLYYYYFATWREIAYPPIMYMKPQNRNYYVSSISVNTVRSSSSKYQWQ